MGLVTGFFTRQEIKAKIRGEAKDQGLSVQRLHELGERGVEQMNPRAHTRHMKPTGSKHPDLYILGETPGPDEDEEGKPFVGPTGEYLREAISNLRGDDFRLRFDNCVRTMPKRRKKGLKPNTHEIECYRPSVERSIVEAKPRAILALGDTATQWCLSDEVGAISCCRGRKFPTIIGGHPVWVYPMHHPHYILGQLSSEDYEQIDGEEHAKYFERDLARVFRELPDLKPPRVEDETKLDEGVQIVLKDVGIITRWLERAMKEKIIALDVETNRRRPYEPGAKLLTLSIATSFGTLAFPIDHPQATWSRSERETLDRALKKFFHHSMPKIAHNTPFDLEWLVWKYGISVAFECFWHDTMDQAYHLDERKGGMSLNFLNILHFGLKLKAQSTGTVMSTWFGLNTSSSGQIDRAKLEFTNVTDVCRYNGRDSKYTLKLYYRQKKLLIADNQWEPYREHVRRVVSCVTAQRIGLPVDAKTVTEFAEKEAKEIRKLEKEIQDQPIIRKFNRKYGQYKDSNKNNAQLFWGMLRIEDVKKGNRISTSEKVLEGVKHPLAKKLVQIRKHRKLKGTYLDRFDRKHPETLTYSDGRIHCFFNHTRTETKRMCVAEDTLLETNLGNFKIAECPLQLNGQNCLIQTHENRWRQITAKWFKGYEPMLRLTFENGAFIECTKRHRLLCESGWEYAGDLRLGDSAITDPSFQRRYDSSESMHCFRKRRDANHKNFARMVCDRVFLKADNPQCPLSKRIGYSFQDCFSVQAVVSSQIPGGLQGGIPEELLRKQNGEHLWQAEVSETPASFNSIAVLDRSGMDRREDCEGVQNLSTYGPKKSNLLPDKTSIGSASAIWENHAKGMVCHRGLVSRPLRSSSRNQKSEGSSTGRVRVLEGIHSFGSDSREVEAMRQNHQPGGSEATGQEGLLVDESRRVKNNPGTIKEENSLSSASPGYSSQCCRLHAAHTQSNSRGGRRLSFHKRSRGKGYTTRRTFVESRIPRVPSVRCAGQDLSQKDAGKNPKTVKLVSIQELPPQAVWDITVEGDHSYASQGLYHHNSASEPSNQNWPKRKNKWIRAVVVAPPKHYMLCFDQGQLEYRVLGMASRDKIICKSLFDDYDVHMVWAEKVARVYPQIVRERYGSLDKEAMKLFRSAFKNDVVFPWFYGASLNLACRALDNMPQRLLAPIYEEFFDKEHFYGVKQFQIKQQGFYEKYGYVQALTGHRRHGPMSKNQLINAPIQGAASDIVVWSWNELNRIAYESDQPWLMPALNVHDDLSFFIPKSKVDEAVPIIVDNMCNVPFDFINVPLMVEGSIGTNWADQHEIGKFRSDRLDFKKPLQLPKELTHANAA